jgi:ABC-type bacteriocin/lantibiotic exporter with double-glycine peptidase domain
MLMRVAEQFGLSARAHVIAGADVGSISLPAIAHWESRHFVVVERHAPDRVTIVDPAIGRRVLSASEFEAGYAGSVLTFEPRPDIVRRRRARVPLWVWYLAAMFRDRTAVMVLVQVIASSLLLQAAGLAAPVFTKIVVDDLAPGTAAVSLGVVAAAMAIIIVGRSLTSLLRSVLMIRLQTRLDLRLTQGFFEHLLRLPFRFFQGRGSGDLLMRLSSNTMIREILTTQLVSFVLDGPFGVVYLLILAIVSPPLAALAASLAVAQAGLAVVSLRALRDLSPRAVVTKADEQSCLVELMKGIAYIKASGAEQRAYARWAELFRRQLTVFVERSYVSAKIELAIGIARVGSPLALLWYGAYLVATHELALGTMLALVALAGSFLAPIVGVVQNVQQLQLLDVYVERLTDVLRTQPERESGARPRTVNTRLTGRVEARGLSFRYSADAPLVVDDVSFVVAPGSKLGIVGPTASGKSTILMLLLGLFEPTAGEILYDGIPLSDLDPRDIRKQCGVVLQDSAVFAGTLRSNIELNVPDAVAEDVARAAQLAGLGHEIARLPLGYETLVSEGGTSLSGGQRQRLAIARALVSQPSVLLLDEASSHLDVASEQQLISNLESLSCTRIVVAHRLTAVRSADEILVLQRGRIVERGGHADLIHRAGPYAALAAAQTTQAPSSERLTSERASAAVAGAVSPSRTP